jgi:hypothetical protein
VVWADGDCAVGSFVDDVFERGTLTEQKAGCVYTGWFELLVRGYSLREGTLEYGASNAELIKVCMQCARACA